MKQLKGPNLKASELKVPPVLRDLYSDLRDRRLLPLLGLVLVAIVAVPFLLSESPPTEEAPLAGGGGSQEAAQASALTVVEAQPRLRDYRRRLRGRAPTNPFRQRFAGPMLKGARLQSVIETVEPATSSIGTASEGSSGGGSGSVAVPPASPEGGGGETAAPPSKSAAGGGTDEADLLDYRIDIQIAQTEEDEVGNRKMGKPVVRKGVESLTPLPGEKAPVVTFLGANVDTERALFMVSKDVTAVFGDAKCVSGTESCELMELERGFPQIFEYGPNEVRYKINVLRIDLVPAADQMPRP
jgi:hypothetical protein